MDINKSINIFIIATTAIIMSITFIYTTFQIGMQFALVNYLYGIIIFPLGMGFLFVFLNVILRSCLNNLLKSTKWVNLLLMFVVIITFAFIFISYENNLTHVLNITSIT